MLSNLISTTAVVLAATQLVSAQTHTDCNPMEKSCPDDDALGTTLSIDFTKGKNDFFLEAEATEITYDENGAVFTINKETEAPTIYGDRYIFFGKIDVEVQAAPGQGVVTSFVLQSDNLDEIDWEWLGGDITQVQTNYFGKGDITTYDRGAYHDVSSPQTETHMYSIDWTKDYVRWSIDGTQVRELLYADAKGGSQFPQTPMQVKLGTWVAGRSDAEEGTVEWAGGKTDFSQAPFVAHYKSIKITDYSNGVKNADKYVWDDGSDGSYQSINVVTGDGSDDGNDDEDSTTDTTAKRTSSKTDSPTSTETGTSDTTATTMSTATSSGTSSTTSGAATPPLSFAPESTGTTGGDSSTDTSESPASTSSSPVQAAGFKTGFSGVLLGAGLLVAAVF